MFTGSGVYHEWLGEYVLHHGGPSRSTKLESILFGSLDSANFVTLDKPPFAVWVSSLSAKVFGFSSFSILLPHVIAGLVALLLVYITVRRYFGIKAAIVSAVSFMCMPIAIVVFRYNLPDSLMTAMLVASAYTFLRSLEKPAIRWMIGTGILIGFAFNTKMIQALIILPVMGLMYLILSHQKCYSEFEIFLSPVWRSLSLPCGGRLRFGSYRLSIDRLLGDG